MPDFRKSATAGICLLQYAKNLRHFYWSSRADKIGNKTNLTTQAGSQACYRFCQIARHYLYVRVINVRNFRYAGSKGALADCIISLMPTHKVYIEPFAGSASVFLRKQPSNVEVLNDINGDLMNFYRICQCHPQELLRCLRFHLASRQWFELWKHTGNEGLTDVMRAAKFFYLQMNAFGGQVIDQHFGTGKSRPPVFCNSRIVEVIEGLHRRLERTYVEQLPYQEILRRYDESESLFYLDPPYFLKRKYYRVEFQFSEYVELRDLLLALKGKFILSINDSVNIRRLFSCFNIISKTVQYSSNQFRKTKRGAELIIHNLEAQE